MDKVEAIKILKDFHDKSALFSVRTALETLHPELAESEDERMRRELISYFKNNSVYIKWSGLDVKKVIKWLEKQGEQKKDTCEGCNNVKGCVTCVDGNNWTHYYYEDGQKIWSEEDEKMLDNLITYLDGRKNLLEEIKIAYIDWLKSLKPQNRWKPTKEQLVELRHVISGCSFEVSILVELEEQLKKLL